MDPGKQAGHLPSGFRALLVEDEIMVALLLEELLVELGYRVIGPIGRLNKALEIAQREALDVGILDVNLNGEGVFPVAEALATRGIPFIFVTGYGRGGLPAQYRDSLIMPKPFHVRDLQRILEEARLGNRN